MATTADRIALKKLVPKPLAVVRPVAAGHVIGANTLVGVRSDNGQVEPLQNGGSYNEVLVSFHRIDTTGNAGPKYMTLYRNVVIELEGTGFTPDLIGQAAYASDEKTVSATQGEGDILVGTFYEEIDSNRIFVYIK